MEIAGIVASLLGVYYSSQRKTVAWIWNILASSIYMLVFYRAGLYSDMELQGVFILMAIYGIYQWKQVESDWKPSKNNLSQIMIGLLIASLYGLVAGYLHERFSDQVKTPYWDATLTGMSILGTYWAAQRKIENWILWIFVDAAYVAMYVFNGLLWTAALYTLFIFMAFRGWYSWHKELKIN
jgi:nicotinamide mononucleotide transporter